MQSEEELKRLARFLEQKVEAVEFLNSLVKEHQWSCPYDDPTGYPAPCTCGVDKSNAIIGFIKRTVLTRNFE